MIFPHTVVLYRSVLAVDSRGNELREPGTTGVTLPGFFHPGTQTEDRSVGQVRQAQPYVLLPHRSGADAYSALVYNGVRYEVEGDPATYDTPNGAHDTVRLRKPAGEVD